MFVIWSLIFGNSSLAVNDQTGTNPGNFLKLSGGVKPVAMGNAFVAIADDISAIYWNPAGLTQLRSPVFSSMYSTWLADMSYSNISFAAPVSKNMMTGLSLDYVSAGQIDETTASQPYGTGKSFTPSFFTINFPLAFQTLPPLSIGFNIKALFDIINTSEAIGYGVDAGMLWKITDNVSAGFCARNLAGSIAVLPDAKGQSSQNPQAKSDLASNYAFGLSYRLPFLLLGLDYNVPSDNQGSFNLGAEYNLKDFFFGRIGFSTRSEENAGGNFGAGLGLKFGILKLDYAYAPYGDLGITHRLSLGLIFPESKEPIVTAEAGPAPSAEVNAIPSLEVAAVPSIEVKSIISSVASQETKTASLEAPPAVKKAAPPKKVIKKKIAKKIVHKKKR